MEVRINPAAPVNLHRYDDTSGNWGWLLRRMVNDGLQRREVVASPTSAGNLSYSAVRREPREWQVVLQLWGRTYEALQVARAFLTQQFFPTGISDDDLLRIQARRSPSVAWREIRALCTGIEFDEEEDRFTAIATVNLFSPQPLWFYDETITFTPSTVLNTNSWVRANLFDGSIVTTGAAITALRRLHYVPSAGQSYVGSATSGSVWQINNSGMVVGLGAITGGTIGGIRVLSNGVLIAGLFENVTNPLYFWNGSSWVQITNGMNSGIRRINPADVTDRYLVCGLFSAPRKLVAVFDNGNSLITTYDDIFSDLVFNINEALCTDAVCFDGTIVAVARRTASPFVRYIRVGSLAGKAEIASWNENSDINFATTITGVSLHDLYASGTITSLNVGILGLRRAIRIRNLGGIEQAGDVEWTATTQQMFVRRVGNKIFAGTIRGAGDNWVLLWTGGGWVPILWLNNNVQDIGGDENDLIVVGNFTQVQRWTEVNLPVSISNIAAAVDFSFGSGTSGTFHGAAWTDDDGAIVIDQSLSFIPSFVSPSSSARIGTDYYRLAQGRGRTNANGSRQMLMLRNIVGNIMNARVYLEDPRM